MPPVTMTSGRDEAEVIGLVPIPLLFGGELRKLPVLVITENRAWCEALNTRLREEIDGLDTVKSWDQIAGYMVGLTDAMLDLLILYDEHGTLGGREWIESHASPDQVYEAFKAVCLVAFPILREAKTLPGLTGLVLTYLQGRLTPSSSRSGGSTRRPSTAAGPTSSGSSTRSSSATGSSPAPRPRPIGSSRRSPRGSRSR